MIFVLFCRLFRKHYFGASDEVELKFVSRCSYIP
jgi:hypothetical protein